MVSKGEQQLDKAVRLRKIHLHPFKKNKKRLDKPNKKCYNKYRKKEREVRIMYYVCDDEGIIGTFASYEEAEEFLEERDDGDMWISSDED